MTHFDAVEKSDALKQMYKEKFNQYEMRAKQIKKQALDARPPEDNNAGDASTATAKKPPKKK